MKRITQISAFILTLFFFSLGAKAQVTVGANSTPKATLDVIADSSTITTADGVLVPRLSLAKLMAKTGYSTEQNGALVYINSINATGSGTTAKVTATGFYWYSASAGVWVPLMSGTTAQPTWFYMPSIPIDVSVTGTYTKYLYNLYCCPIKLLIKR